jgi:hypothetical protein
MLSVIIPGRHEEWFQKTVEDVLSHAKGDTEVIAICDEVWPDPPLQDHPRLTVVHFTTPVGQRGGMNMGARISRAKYVMKLDAHCAVDDGFDLKLIAPYEDGRLGADVTTIPRLLNLFVYNWQCQKCKWETYQGRKPLTCPTCQGTVFEKSVVWEPRKSRRTDFARFDSELHFQYDPKYERRPEAQGDIADVMSSVGACWFMRRDRFWAQGGLIEAHGTWGQVGTEVACQAWLSGGRQVVNKTTFYSHYFRVNGAGFPYLISGNDQERARVYSRNLWRNNAWPLQVRPLHWLIEKFWPVNGWTEEDLAKLKTSRVTFPSRKQ